MTHPEPVGEALSRIKAAAPAAKFMPHNTELVFRDAETLANYIESIAVPVDPISAFLREVAVELQVARAKFPGDVCRGMAFSEEAGELIKAMLDEPAENVRKEAVQVAAMAARIVLDGDGSTKQWREYKGLDALGVQ